MEPTCLHSHAAYQQVKAPAEHPLHRQQPWDLREPHYLQVKDPPEQAT